MTKICQNTIFIEIINDGNFIFVFDYYIFVFNISISISLNRSCYSLNQNLLFFVFLSFWWSYLRGRGGNACLYVSLEEVIAFLFVPQYLHVLFISLGFISFELLSRKETHHAKLLLVKVKVVVLFFDFWLEVKHFFIFMGVQVTKTKVDK